eukprot:190985-Alexandrium_andersonii.AAC.1
MRRCKSARYAPCTTTPFSDLSSHGKGRKNNHATMRRTNEQASPLVPLPGPARPGLRLRC